MQKEWPMERWFRIKKNSDAQYFSECSALLGEWLNKWKEANKDLYVKDAHFILEYSNNPKYDFLGTRCIVGLNPLEEKDEMQTH